MSQDMYNESLSSLISMEQNIELREEFENLRTVIGQKKFIERKLEKYTYIVISGLTTLKIYWFDGENMKCTNFIMGRPKGDYQMIFNDIRKSSAEGKCLHI